jgi:hypothetical protein
VGQGTFEMKLKDKPVIKIECESPLCDICCSLPPTCRFMAPDMTLCTLNNEGQDAEAVFDPHWKSTGYWATCDHCATLLEAGQLTALVTRALECYETKSHENLSLQDWQIIGEILLQQYKQIQPKRETLWP